MKVQANTVRPEGRGNGQTIVGASFAVLAIAGAIACIAGSFVCAHAKKWGYDGDHVIHNLDLYHKGFITSMVGLGALLVFCSSARVTLGR
jgi:hypothetical protein